MLEKSCYYFLLMCCSLSFGGLVLKRRGRLSRTFTQQPVEITSHTLSKERILVILQWFRITVERKFRPLFWRKSWLYSLDFHLRQDEWPEFSGMYCCTLLFVLYTYGFLKEHSLGWLFLSSSLIRAQATINDVTMIITRGTIFVLLSEWHNMEMCSAPPFLFGE